MSSSNKPTRAQEHQKSNRQLLPRKLQESQHEPQYAPLDVSDIPRTALTSVACNNCRVRKSKVCPAALKDIGVISLSGIGDLEDCPDEQAQHLLETLRSSGSVSEFLQVLDSGIIKPPSPTDPLATSLAGTSVDSTIELDLNMRFSGVFPVLETLDIKNVDLGLLAVNKRALASLNQQVTAPLTPFTPIEFGPRSETPTTSESFSTPSDTTGDTGVDPRLESLQIWQWTSIPIPESLAAQAISFYLANEHPLLAFFDADLFIRDFVAGGGRFCSQLLVSSLLAWACASYSQFEPRAQTLSLAFLREAKRRWKDLTNHTAITTLSSAMLLVLTCNQHGQDKVGLFYLDASVQIGRGLGLFSDDGTSVPDFNDDDDETRTAASFAAWGAFGWHRKHFELTNLTMFITPGLLTLINEVFQNPGTSDAQFYFILAARGCLSIASWCKGLRGITEGLMTIGWQNGTFKREGWTNNSMIEDIRATTRALNQEGTYSSLYPINLDSASESMDDIGMEALAGEFQRLSSQNEPTRGKEVEMTSEPNAWKGNQRDLDLTLTEATEEQEYT
ncbi:nitrate assimilation regulatory nirA [Fusarium agapanthi]|uniref:Nitrate assimilation regulatory nirA n=1 Tax=Fusarium agapanthi TaxID=1803897 RepID=A0A9P5BMB4_9HYPO|nr:nitrate assimilation regulatory nirA [Fusarium agapanthi]